MAMPRVNERVSEGNSSGEFDALVNAHKRRATVQSAFCATASEGSKEPQSPRVSPIRSAAPLLSSPDTMGELLGEQWLDLQNLVQQISAVRGSQKSLPGERVRKTPLSKEGDRSVEGRASDRNTVDKRGVASGSEGREQADGIAGGAVFVPAGKPGASTGIWVDPSAEPVVSTVGGQVKPHKLSPQAGLCPPDNPGTTIPFIYDMSKDPITAKDLAPESVPTVRGKISRSFSRTSCPYPASESAGVASIPSIDTFGKVRKPVFEPVVSTAEHKQSDWYRDEVDDSGRSVRVRWMTYGLRRCVWRLIRIL